MYDCTQIRVNYKLPINTSSEDEAGPVEGGRAVGGVEDDEDSTRLKKPRYERAIRDYEYIEDLDDEDFADDEDDDAGLPKPFPTGTNLHPVPFVHLIFISSHLSLSLSLSTLFSLSLSLPLEQTNHHLKLTRERRTTVKETTLSEALYLTSLNSRVRSLLGDNETKFAGLMGNDSEWYFTGAKLFPNVKGCGYPPVLNCSIFYQQYANIGHNFSCYYSKVDPGIVISELDMWQVSPRFRIFI